MGLGACSFPSLLSVPGHPRALNPKPSFLEERFGLAHMGYGVTPSGLLQRHQTTWQRPKDAPYPRFLGVLSTVLAWA